MPPHLDDPASMGVKSATTKIDMSAANHLPLRGDELIRVVTRFEYALKALDYGRAGRDATVEANWDEFVNARLKTKFWVHVVENNLAPTILTNPPSRQTLRGRTLDWEKTSPPTNVQELFGAVRRVRNNLVHGGKSGDKDSDRNTSLVSEAIEVLLLALTWDLELLRA